MRQVPHTLPTYLLIGGGRMAKHLGCYFSLSDVNHITWNRRSNTPEQLTDALKRSTHILLAISDDSIEQFVLDHELVKSSLPLIHFSGSKSFASINGLHPLMTFGPNLESLSFYKNILFVGDNKNLEFQQVFPQLENKSITLQPSDKKKYHALCVLLGNGSQVLWQNVTKEMAKLGVCKHTSNLYLQQNFLNFLRDPQTSLTGPWVRNDTNTTKQNIDSLKNTKFHSTYQALLELHINSQEQETPYEVSP